MKHRGIALAAAALVAAIAVAAAAAAGGGRLSLGPAAQGQEPTYLGYYDGHKDLYVVTDTSSKSQAAAMSINYSSELASVKGAPSQYFISGPAAAGAREEARADRGRRSHCPQRADP